MTRPYIGPHRVTLIGRNHFNPSHMTDMQRERADAPLQDVGRAEPLRRSVLAAVIYLGGVVSLGFLWAVFA